MDSLELLVRTRELLSDPERWTRGVSARDSRDGAVEPHHPDAAKWCVIGGIMRFTGVDCTEDYAHPEVVSPGGSTSLYLEATQYLHRQWGRPAWDVNDSSGTHHDYMLHMLDAAIAAHPDNQPVEEPIEELVLA